MRKIENLGIISFGYIEAIIGAGTIISLFVAKVAWGATKPLGILSFVGLTALASFILGIGILKYKMWARRFLIFFSGYIVLTKLFIYLGVIKLSPPFEILIPSSIKNIISVIYHVGVILFLGNENIRRSFK